jgi:hypothetical protein
LIEPLPLQAKETSTGQRIIPHVVDGVALLPRIQALLLLIKTPVLSGH